jgi:hypothetical protein
MLGGVAYLWKTDTQLRGPDSHFSWYFLKSGFTDSRNGPMKGAFHAGPTIEPLVEMYLTARGSAMSGANASVCRTLVVHNSRYQERQHELPRGKPGEDGRKEAVGVELLYHMGDLRVCRRRHKTRVDRHIGERKVAQRSRDVGEDARRRRREVKRSARASIGVVLKIHRVSTVKLQPSASAMQKGACPSHHLPGLNQAENYLVADFVLSASAPCRSSPMDDAVV